MDTYDQARAILQRTDPEAVLRSQPADDWTGEYPLPAAVAAYYAELGPDDLSIRGYGNGYFLPSLANLWEHQTGYRTHGHTGERLSDWEEDWLVVGDEGGDPFIFSRERGRGAARLPRRGQMGAARAFPRPARDRDHPGHPRRDRHDRQRVADGRRLPDPDTLPGRGPKPVDTRGWFSGARHCHPRRAGVARIWVGWHLSAPKITASTPQAARQEMGYPASAFQPHQV